MEQSLPSVGPVYSYQMEMTCPLPSVYPAHSYQMMLVFPFARVHSMCLYFKFSSQHLE